MIIRTCFTSLSLTWLFPPWFSWHFALTTMPYDCRNILTRVYTASQYSQKVKQSSKQFFCVWKVPMSLGITKLMPLGKALNLSRAGLTKLWQEWSWSGRNGH